MKTLEERFNEKWIPVPESGCWLWIGAERNGYGRIARAGDGKPMNAHWVSLEIYSGAEIKSGSVVMHKCDNSFCVNPNHLSIGTQADNMSDMWAKGRGADGEKVAGNKLSEADVIAIRRMIGANVSIAGKYGVSESTIRDIKKERTWRKLI